jgi:hypothetical protein
MTTPSQADAEDLHSSPAPAAGPGDMGETATERADTDPAANTYVPPPREDPLEPRTTLLHRRVVKIRPERIEIGPPKSAVIAPAIGVALTAFLLASIVIWTDSLPFWTLPVMLLISVVVMPLSGLSLVYAVFGANVVADRAGQNVSFKQRFLGLGVGTNELVPFWKIRELLVEDAARLQRHAAGDEPALQIAQWRLVLVKKSGKRLELGSFNVPRSQEEEGLDVVMDVAEALAAMSEAPIRGPIW